MSDTLYDRLGKYEGISAIVKDAVKNHLDNPVVAPRYAGSDIPKVERLATEFFCMGAGGPEKYTGRTMLDTHKHMNISEQEFIGVIDDILAALDKHNIAAETRTEVLGILYSMKDEIVRV